MSSPVADRLAILQGGGISDRPFLDIVRCDEELAGETSLDGVGSLQFGAAGIRKERSGTHARVTIGLNGQTIAYSWINTDRDEDRTRLANSAANRFSTAKERGPAVKLRLDLFCERLWTTWTHTQTGSWLEGDEQFRPRWMLNPFLIEDGGTILFGPPGGGKSWIALLWSLGLTYGRGLPWDTRQARTLFVNLERGAKSIQWRVARCGHVLGIEQPRMLAMSARGRTLEDVLDPLKETVRREKVEHVVVDSLSRAGTGDLTQNDAANRAMDALNGLGVAWTVIAHAPRGDNTHTYGSVMFDAAADLCVRLTSATNDDDPHVLGIALETTKANDVPKASQQQWALVFGNDGPATIRPARNGEFLDLAPIRANTRALVRDYLASNGATAAVDIADDLKLEPGRVRDILRGEEFVKVRKDGRKQLYGLASNAEEPA